MEKSPDYYYSSGGGGESDDIGALSPACPFLRTALFSTHVRNIHVSGEAVDLLRDLAHDSPVEAFSGGNHPEGLVEAHVGEPVRRCELFELHLTSRQAVVVGDVDFSTAHTSRNPGCSDLMHCTLAFTCE